MALTARQIRDLDQFRRHWGNEDPVTDTAVKSRDRLVKLRSLAERLVAMQRCFHESGCLGGPFSVKEIGSLVNALLRSKLPVPREALIGPLKSRAVRDPSNAQDEHDSPISFFRDLLIRRSRMSAEEWIYVLLKYHRIIKITDREDARLTLGRDGRSWKSNRPLDAYEQCQIHLHKNSIVALKNYNYWVGKQIKAMSRRRRRNGG